MSKFLDENGLCKLVNNLPPLKPGSGTNSVVSRNSSAISANSIADSNSFAGLKGFIFNDTTYPTDEQSVFSSDGTFILRATNRVENPVKDFYDFSLHILNSYFDISFLRQIDKNFRNSQELKPLLTTDNVS